MVNIEELYDEIYALLQSVQSSDSADKALMAEREQNRNIQIERLIEEIELRLTEIMPYNTTASAFVSAAVTQKKYAPSRPDLQTLERLYYKATNDSIHGLTCWEEIYRVSASGIAYYNQQRNDLLLQKSRKHTIKSSTQNNEQCRRILEGVKVRQLIDALVLVNEMYTPRILANKSYSAPQRDSAALFGRVTKPFPVTDGCISLVKQLFGSNYCEDDQTVLLPCLVPAVTLFQINSNSANQVMSAIHAYIVSFLCHTTPSQYKIGYFDNCSMDSSCLGVLRPLEGYEKVIMPIPTNQEEVRKQLKQFRHVITTTNSQHLLIYRYNHSLFDSQSVLNLQWLCANSAHYNTKIMIVQEFAPNSEGIDYSIPGWIPAESLIIRPGIHRNLESIISHSRIATYPEPEALSKDFIDGILLAYKPPKLNTRYFDVRPKHTNLLNLQRQRKKTISLLYGVDRRGERVYLNLKDTDFSAYILGNAGAGKSNLLNVLITSAIMDYHPDDLELWLVDFGRTEFTRYIKHTPPHIRYVMVEKTTELVCSLVEKLIEEMDQRGKVMSKYHSLKMQDLPESVQMPMLLTIIDEFGVFKEILSSDEFDEKKKYRDYMERLLKQGRKHGMYFIFANQSFSDVYKALPEEGSDQIGLRLSMMGKESEMKAVLAIKGFHIGEDEETRIRRLPKYQIIYRSLEQGGSLSDAVHVLFLSDDDIQVQESIIDEMNIMFKPIASSRNDSPSYYFQRQRLCLDHNAVPTILDLHSEIIKDYREWMHNIAYQSTDLLLYLGEPRNMDPIHHELVRNGQSENLLLYGDYARSLEKVASVIESIIYSSKIQDWPIEFWCDKNDPLSRIFLERWHVDSVIDDPYRLISRVKELNKNVKGKSLARRLFVLSGLSAMALSIKAEIEERNEFDSEREMDGTGFQMIRDLMANGGVTEPKEKKNDLVDFTTYMGPLLKYAPRYDSHFVIVIQKEGELSDMRITTDHFTHYAAFASGMSDTQHYQLKKRVDKISEGEMFGCLTGNGEFTVYMPFSMRRREK